MPAHPLKTLPRRIRKVVNRNGGAKVLANRLGVSQACVYYWLQGRTRPDVKSLYQIGNLGEDIHVLIMGD